MLSARNQQNTQSFITFHAFLFSAAQSAIWESNNLYLGCDSHSGFGVPRGPICHLFCHPSCLLATCPPPAFVSYGCPIASSTTTCSHNYPYCLLAFSPLVLGVPPPWPPVMLCEPPTCPSLTVPGNRCSWEHRGQNKEAVERCECKHQRRVGRWQQWASPESMGPGNCPTSGFADTTPVYITVNRDVSSTTSTD